MAIGLCWDSIVTLGGGHADRPVQVLGVVAGGGEDDPLLSGPRLYLSHPSRLPAASMKMTMT